MTLYSFIKNSFHKCFPNLHTLYSPDKYKSLLKSIENRELPNIRQPVNIQSSHLDKDHSYFLSTEILNYSVTNKLDGVNYKCHILKDKGFIVLQSNTDLWLEKINATIPFNSILNVEVIQTGEIYVFDILMYTDDDNITKGLDILYTNLENRLKVAQSIVELIKGPKVSMKIFFSSSDVVKNIHNCIQFMSETYGLNDSSEKMNYLNESGVELYNDGISSTAEHC